MRRWIRKNFVRLQGKGHIMADIGDKYHGADTSYEPDTAEYDAAEFNFQIVDLSGDIIALCPTAAERDMILAKLNAK